MRKLFFLLAFFPLTAFAVPPLSAFNPGTIPGEIQKDGQLTIIKDPSFKNWRIITSQNHASLNWDKDLTSTLNLYITPAPQMITIDVIAKKSTYKEFKLPFIIWNIKEVSVTLNKTQDKDGWVTFTTTIYTDNINKLVKALQNNAPMTLNLSTLTSIPITLDGLQPALKSFIDVIRQKRLQAPPLLTLTQPAAMPSTPPDGMSPKLFPLFHQADYYVKKCTSLASEPLTHSTRHDICMKRNDYLKKMQNEGWCWGSGDSEQHDKDKNWRLCILSPKGNVPKLTEQAHKDLKKAESMTQK